VATEQVDPEPPWEVTLRHERIPFVSYPYEWTFSMLQDAAILHLDLLLDALNEGMTMKDGYAFNVQWQGTRPVFIDVPSFERNPQGGPWAGYRQFCQTFLYPLLLQAHKDVPFRYWMRGSVNGLETRDVRNVMSTRDLLRAGVLKHVVLHGAMEARFTGKAQAVQSELRDDYRQICNYTDADRGAKEAFVKQAAVETAPRLAWDLGANDGAYARLVAEHAGHVLAVDADELVVETLYRALRQERNTTILPLVMNLADASPGLGWRGRERKAFDQRDRPDLVLALATTW
jgi:hypothetical protein